jgi:hypothetical protein
MEPTEQQQLQNYVQELLKPATKGHKVREAMMD